VPYAREKSPKVLIYKEIILGVTKMGWRIDAAQGGLAGSGCPLHLGRLRTSMRRPVVFLGVH
jgi:hypothetical protein